jgi:glycosyltransferase involved in cell wall biosynthesis
MKVGKAVPKFSVLLPTRDRFDLAKGAIETVRRQSYENWELIIADNCSSDDVAGHVRTLNDRRIVYTRSDSFLPVTENWNRALDASSGEYVIMLGDDDGLTPGYFERVLDVMHRLGNPDFLYHGAYHFAFPGALPCAPDGLLIDVTLQQSILRNLSEPGLMASGEARMVACKALDMWVYYGFNMQYFVFSREFLTKMSKFGVFFKGPFPDFYAANMAMLLAEKIGLMPEPMVIIGISPKSYGFYHFNRREKGGIALLQAGRDPFVGAPPALRAALLPGTNMLNSWLISVALIPQLLPDQPDLVLGVKRYRRLQIFHNLRSRALGEPYEAEFSSLWPQLNWRERILTTHLRLILFPCRLRFLPERWRQRWANLANKLAARQQPWLSRLPQGRRPFSVEGKYKSMSDVFAGLGKAANPSNQGNRVK